MKNTSEDLNNHLMAAIERLSDEELDAEELEKEIARAAALGKVADRIIHNNALVLKAAVAVSETGAAVPAGDPETNENRVRVAQLKVRISEARKR